MDLRADAVVGLASDDGPVEFRCHRNLQSRLADHAGKGARIRAIAGRRDDLAAAKPSQLGHGAAAVRLACDRGKLVGS